MQLRLFCYTFRNFFFFFNLFISIININTQIVCTGSKYLSWKWSKSHSNVKIFLYSNTWGRIIWIHNFVSKIWNKLTDENLFQLHRVREGNSGWKMGWKPITFKKVKNVCIWLNKLLAFILKEWHNYNEVENKFFSHNWNNQTGHFGDVESIIVKW